MALTITRNQTPTFFARIAGSNGAAFDVPDFNSGECTVYKSSKYLTSRVPNSMLTPVPGFEAVAIGADAIIPASTVAASGLTYNFKFTFAIDDVFPFADVGIYFVEFRVYPQSGNPIVWQRTIEVI